MMSIDNNDMHCDCDINEHKRPRKLIVCTWFAL